NTIATYEKERSYIERFPELLRNEAMQLNIAASFINVLNPTIIAYAKLRDTTGLNKALALSESIYDALGKHQRWRPQSSAAFTVGFYMKSLYYSKYFSLDSNRYKSREALHNMERALYGDTTQPASLIRRLAPELDRRLVDYYLTYGENDSA